MREAIEYGGPPAGLCRVLYNTDWKVGYEEPITDREGPRAFSTDSFTGTTFGAYFDLFSASFSDSFLGGFLGGPWPNFGSILEASGRPFCLPKSIKKMIEFLEGFWKHFGLTFQRIFFNCGVLFDTIFERL